MQDLLTGYEVNPPTWFYLSLLLILAVFFRFGRVWSLRNLDLLLLLSIAPGLLMVEPERLGVRADEAIELYGKLQLWGSIWLFVGSGLVLVRLLCDSLFERRPAVAPNLNAAGLVFLGVAAFVFLMTKVLVEPPSAAARAAVAQGEKVVQAKVTDDGEADPTPAAAGAAASVLARMAGKSGREPAAQLQTVLAHLAIVIGLFLVGRNHFRDSQQGTAMATLYLLIPCTAYDIGEVNHVLPAALCVWAFVAVHRPLIAGGLMGLACGSLSLLPVFLFLLPLWFVYYERRRAVQFALSLVVVGGAVLVGVLALTSPDLPEFSQRLAAEVDAVVDEFQGAEIVEGSGGAGFWKQSNLVYRIPVIVVFLVLLVHLTIWPRRKTLEHLIAHTAALVVATQFWYSHQGGVFVLWYLPLLLLVVFRPRLLPPVRKPAPSQAPATTGGWNEPIGSHVPVGTGSSEGTGRLWR